MQYTMKMFRKVTDLSLSFLCVCPQHKDTQTGSICWKHAAPGGYQAVHRQSSHQPPPL